MRYVTLRPRSVVLYEMDQEASVTADQVIVSDDAPIDSGLLDVSGNRLFRVAARIPLGFAAERLNR